MWTIIKIDKSRFHLLKKEFETKLGSEYQIYVPKLKIQKFKNNKIIEKNLDLLGDYIFCFHKNFTTPGTINQLKYMKGLKYFVQGFFSAQDEIESFVSKCKKMENREGFITENIFSIDIQKKYKFANGPFTGKLFKILRINKNKLSVLIGNFKTELNKRQYLFNPV